MEIKPGFVLLLVLALALGAAQAQERPFEGVEVNVLTFTGPQIAEPLQRRAPDFNELTAPASTWSRCRSPTCISGC
jgi:multiple sugar transport system substrate-binding protein